LDIARKEITASILNTVTYHNICGNNCKEKKRESELCVSKIILKWDII
jgi:hypothetical protein